jgi:hypothetical protein
MFKITLTVLSLIIILVNSTSFVYYPVDEKPVPKEIVINPLVKYDFRNLRDTLYTMQDHFIEVNLSTQHATLHSRDGSKMVFPVSSGNEKVEDGIETREGLYVIKWMSKKVYSEQFDSTLMLYWMGFNGGVGFHALLGNRYYKYLGKRNVSHGCVRITREDAEILYSTIEKGTPVLVHKGNSAVTIGFGKMGEVYKYYSYGKLYKILPKRYSKIYNGSYFTSLNNKLLIDEKNVGLSGLPIGNAYLIPAKQNIKPFSLWVDNSTTEADKLQYLIGEREKNSLTFNSYLDTRN